jgi:hypothetical protein
MNKRHVQHKYNLEALKHDTKQPSQVHEVTWLLTKVDTFLTA